MSTATKIGWKEIPIYGLEKVPTAALLHLSRVEVGQLKSYIQELEEQIQELKDENDRLSQLLCVDEERRAMRMAIIEAKKEEYVQQLIKGHLTEQQHIEDLKLENSRLFARIRELMKQLDAKEQRI